MLICILGGTRYLENWIIIFIENARKKMYNIFNKYKRGAYGLLE